MGSTRLRRLSPALLALSLLCGSGGGPRAALLSIDSEFGPDSITRDTASGLDWLDVPLTRPHFVQAVPRLDITAELGPGGLFAGFRHATVDEVDNFFAAGTGLPRTPFVNGATAALRELWGCPSVECDIELIWPMVRVGTELDPNPFGAEGTAVSFFPSALFQDGNWEFISATAPNEICLVLDFNSDCVAVIGGFALVRASPVSDPVPAPSPPAIFFAPDQTPNQTAVGSTLTAILANDPAGLQGLLLSLLLLNGTAGTQALDSLSGVQHTHGQVLTSKLSQWFAQLLFNRGNRQPNTQLAFNSFFGFDPLQGHLLADNDFQGPTAATEPSGSMFRQRGWWLQGFGGFGDIDSTRDVSGADYETGGIAFGVDTEWRGVVVGAAGSYASTDADTFGGELDIDSFQAAAYGGWQGDGHYLNAVLGFGFHQTDASRSVVAGLTTGTAKADYDTYTFSTAFEMGKDFLIAPATSLTPFAGIEYSHSSRDGFTETGAGMANLNVREKNEDSLRPRFGLRLSRDIATGSATSITPAVQVAYVRELMDNVSRLQAAFAAVPTSTFRIDGSELDRDRLRIGVGVTGQLNQRTTLNVGYDGELAGSDDNHGFSAVVRMVW